MKFDLDMLKKDERVSITLRGLYEKYGFRKYKMSQFEEYSLYAENKSFLSSEKVITFNDIDGRLLALKPDVTLSIAKRTNAGIDKTEKLYYIENVFRYSSQDMSYKEINQMGLELIGTCDTFSSAEVIYLALESLNAIDESFVLDLSHMGYMNGLLSSLGVADETLKEIVSCMRMKNAHDLRAVCKAAGISDDMTGRIERILSLGGNIKDVLAKAETLAINDTMKNAVAELKECCAVLPKGRLKKNIRIDFSIINNLDYYSGIVFQGFVERVPHSVLAGGRYDPLMKKFNLDVNAMGFALYLDSLSRYYYAPAFSVDVAVVYGKDEKNKEGLFKAVQELLSSGKKVWTGVTAPIDIKYEKLMRFENQTLAEVER